MTSPADPKNITWRWISLRGLGNDLLDFAMEVTLLLLGNAGDDRVSRGGEGDKDDPIIYPPYTRAKMG